MTTEYVVVGAGAIGGTVGARLAQDGHSVLLCDADAEHVDAINRDGLAIEGPVEQLTVQVPAVPPAELPDRLERVLLAVKAHHTAEALAAVAPRLAPDGFVVSLQNGLNEPVIADAVGHERTVGALVNFGADVVAPGRIFLGGEGAFFVGELDGRPSERVERLARDLRGAQATRNVLGLLWSKEAYGAMLFATAVSDLPIADALAEPRYRRLFVRLAEEVLEVAPAAPEAFDGFDPHDLPGSIERLVEFNRRSAKTHSGVYRDLAVRRRKTEAEALLGPIDRPNVRRTLAVVRAIEDGRRTCERANLELLAAYARLEERAPALNAVIATLEPAEHPGEGSLRGVPVAIKDNIDVRGVVTTNASTVGVPPPAARDATVVARLREAGAELLCKTNLLEYAAGSVNPAYGMTFNPLDPSRTSGGSSSGSAALVAAGVCDYALGTDTGGSIRIPAAYCGIVGLKPTYGLVPIDGVFPLSVTLDHVGTLTRTVAQAATLLGVLAAREIRRAPSGLHVGLLRRQLDDPAVVPGVRARLDEALAALASAGFELVDVDVPELELAADALGTIVIKEAYDVHRHLFERERDGYGPGTRALLEEGSRVTDETYRRALADRDRVAEGFARAFERVDLLAGPTVAYPAPHEDPPVGTPEGDVEARCTGPYNLAGLPAVSLPCGIAEGALPAGLQLAAAAGEDALLLSTAAAFERAMG